MGISECCGAEVYADYDICSRCLEHCETWYEKEDE